MSVSLNPTGDAVNVDIFNFDQIGNVLGTLDSRITYLLNDPSQNLTREQQIQMIYASRMIHIAFMALQNPLLRDATKAYFEKELQKALQERGISPWEVVNALNQPPIGAVDQVNEVFRNIFPVAAA